MTAGGPALVGAGLGLAALLGSAGAAGAQGTLVAAHRGGALLWPENSLTAFRHALALGVDFLELDVHLTRDGEVVVLHDPTLERTTTGAGRVRERTLAELRGFRLKDREGRIIGEPVPTLDEVLELAAGARVGLLLEIKVGAEGARYPGLEEAVLARLDRYGMAARTVVMAFERDTVRRVRELRPEASVGGLASPRSLRRLGATVEHEMAELTRLGARFIGLHQDLVTAEVVARARAHGLRLGVWTVNDEAAMRRCLGLGADILITDRPDLARRLVGR